VDIIRTAYYIRGDTEALAMMMTLGPAWREQQTINTIMIGYATCSASDERVVKHVTLHWAEPASSRMGCHHFAIFWKTSASAKLRLLQALVLCGRDWTH